MTLHMKSQKQLPGPGPCPQLFLARLGSGGPGGLGAAAARRLAGSAGPAGEGPGPGGTVMTWKGPKLWPNSEGESMENM